MRDNANRRAQHYLQVTPKVKTHVGCINTSFGISPRFSFWSHAVDSSDCFSVTPSSVLYQSGLYRSSMHGHLAQRCMILNEAMPEADLTLWGHCSDLLLFLFFFLPILASLIPHSLPVKGPKPWMLVAHANTPVWKMGQKARRREGGRQTEAVIAMAADHRQTLKVEWINALSTWDRVHSLSQTSSHA